MKELDELTLLNTQTNIEIVKQAEVELTLKGRINNYNNLTLFEYNYNTTELSIAKKVSLSIVDTNGKPTFQSRVTQNKNCIYFLSLNRKNAIKKLNKNNLNVL